VFSNQPIYSIRQDINTKIGHDMYYVVIQIEDSRNGLSRNILIIWYNRNGWRVWLHYINIWIVLIYNT